VVEVQSLHILGQSFQLVNLGPLFLERILQALILGPELLDPVQQFHLVALEGGVLEDETLVLAQPRTLEGNDRGAVLGDDRQVTLVDRLAHLAHLLQQLLPNVALCLRHQIILLIGHTANHSLLQNYLRHLCLPRPESSLSPTCLFFQQIATQISHFVTAKHPLVPVDLSPRLFLPRLALLQLPAFQKLPALPPEILLAKLHLLPHELSRHRIERHPHLSGLLFN